MDLFVFANLYGLPTERGNENFLNKSDLSKERSQGKLNARIFLPCDKLLCAYRNLFNLFCATMHASKERTASEMTSLSLTLFSQVILQQEIT